MMSIELIQGDCLEKMKDIPDGSVDAIICDLPYGTTACAWDSIIDLDLLWKEYKRIIKENGAIVLTASQPFTTKLISSNYDWFKYEWIYQKTAGSNFSTLKYQPMKEHENIVVFSKGKHNYYPIMEDRRGNEKGKTRKATRQESLMAIHEEGVYGIITRDRDSREYGEMRNPSSVQKFNNRNPNDRGLHSTQKPLELMKYLIKTYTNEGEIVLDNCMGSGTTGVACLETNRKFIGIEKDETYFEIAKRRIEDKQKEMVNQSNTNKTALWE